MFYYVKKTEEKRFKMLVFNLDDVVDIFLLGAALPH